MYWFRKWHTVFEWDFPTFRWFLGGLTNLSHNCVDRHVRSGHGADVALLYASERGDQDIFTYTQLLREVERAAAALRGLGVRKFDRITIYMPTCPEAIILRLAATRGGAIHSVVFAGFGSSALARRIRASSSRFVFTAESTFRGGAEIRLKEVVDRALEAV